MAQVPNPRKTFNFLIEIDGINQFLVQKVTPPKMEIEVVMHGDVNSDVKTPGRKIYGEMVWEKIKPADTAEEFAHDWLNQAQNDVTGSGGIAEQYERTVRIKELAPDGVTVLATWTAEDSWCSSLEKGPYDRTTSENIMETATIQVFKYYPS